MFRAVKSSTVPSDVEFVERKGRGHPDSLADALAEQISYEYSRYCAGEFGVIPHHYVDKLVIVGGEARVQAGHYTQVRPMRILLNGRFSQQFGDHKIPVVDIAETTIKAYLPTVLPGIKDDHWEIVDNNNPAKGSSAKGWHWWSPRDKSDIPDIKVRRANDTSVSVARTPYTPVEANVIEAEQFLFDNFVSTGKCGSDIKILAAKVVDNLSVTACVPVLASAISSRSEYDSIRESVSQSLLKIFEGTEGIGSPDIMLNTRDDVAAGDLYLLGLGSAAEHGDLGMVGRGNRMSGVITTDAPMSIDAPWGKNPVYFTGLIYDTCARAVSRSVFEELSEPNTTYIASQNGREISDPWTAVVRVSDISDRELSDIEAVAQAAFTESRKIPALLADIRSRYRHLEDVRFA